MNPVNVLQMLAELAVLKYFPANNEAVLLALARLCGEMCHDEREVRWLVNRMTSGIYQEWPGPREMRACFCTRFSPKDGMVAYSSIFPDGMPPCADSLQIAGPEHKALPPGHSVSIDPKIENAVHIMTRASVLMHNLGGPATQEEIAAAPQWLKSMYGLE